MKTLLILLLAISEPLLFAQDHQPVVKRVARDRSYDVLHYRLNIEIDDAAKSCRGDMAITFVPLRSTFAMMDIDAAEMTIEKVRLEGRSVDFQHHGETLSVDLGKAYTLRDTLTVTVSYSVVAPKQGLYFIPADSGYKYNQAQVWSNGETTENHHWFPCYDYPNDFATSEMIVTVKDKWTAISNGKFIDVRKDAKRRTATYHWYEGKPHVSYLISLVAGEYVEVKDSWGTVPLSYFVYPHQRDDAMRSFAKSPKIMEFYSTNIGTPYPWEKYSQTVVRDYIVGGEENVSATTLTDGTIHDARAHLDYTSDGLVAHEMAHQWFGDLMTCRDWSHLWLNEGFASYFDVLFQEFDRGTDVALKSIYDSQRNIVSVDKGEKRRPPVFTTYTDPNMLFDNRIYGKGACVLHMLRSVVGTELFWKAIRHYVQKHAHQPVETNDFKIAVEEATGYNLHAFFDEWIYGAGYPKFEVSSVWSNASQSVTVSVKQVQDVDSLTGIFSMPVDIEVWVHGTPEVYRVSITEAVQSFSFPAYQQPQLVIFDKGSSILKSVEFNKSVEEWVFQLQHAEHGVDRIAAVEELRWRVDTLNVVEVLSAAAVEDRFADVRLEAVWALADARKTDVSQTLLKTYGDSDARVRSASLRGLAKYKGEEIVRVLQHAFDKDSSYAAATSALRSLFKVDSLNAKQHAKNGMRRDSHGEPFRIASLRGLAEIRDEESYGLIKEQTRYGVARNVRIEALSLMNKNWKGREEVVPFTITMLSDPMLAMRRAAADMLGNSGDARALDPLRRLVDQKDDERLARIARDAIGKIEKAQEQKKSD